MKGAKLPTATAEAAGEEWLLGEAHRVFEKYARSGLKGGKAKKVNPSVKYLNKAMLESPLGEVQPVQMSRSIQQLAEVMRDGIPADGTDDALSEMDRLADML